MEKRRNRANWKEIYRKEKAQGFSKRKYEEKGKRCKSLRGSKHSRKLWDFVIFIGSSISYVAWLANQLRGIFALVSLLLFRFFYLSLAISPLPLSCVLPSLFYTFAFLFCILRWVEKFSDPSFPGPVDRTSREETLQDLRKLWLLESSNVNHIPYRRYVFYSCLSQVNLLELFFILFYLHNFTTIFVSLIFAKFCTFSSLFIFALGH